MAGDLNFYMMQPSNQEEEQLGQSMVQLLEETRCWPLDHCGPTHRGRQHRQQHQTGPTTSTGGRRLDFIAAPLETAGLATASLRWNALSDHAIVLANAIPPTEEHGPA
eukprot:5440310-Prorocentrum_lima.AAC.1